MEEFLIPYPGSHLWGITKESSLQTFHPIWLYLAELCVCACICDSRDFSVHLDLCFFSSLISSVASSYCVCILSVHTHTWFGGDVGLITADGCYEISLHSSFVPVCPIRPCSPPASLVFSLLSLWVLSASSWCALIYSSVLDDACCCSEGQSIWRGAMLLLNKHRWITNRWA